MLLKGTSRIVKQHYRHYVQLHDVVLARVGLNTYPTNISHLCFVSLKIKVFQ